LFVLIGMFVLVLLGIFVYDKGQFQTTMVEKEGMLNEYWHKRLPPLNVKTMVLNVKMHRAMINKDLKELDRIEAIIKKGVLE